MRAAGREGSSFTAEHATPYGVDLLRNGGQLPRLKLKRTSQFPMKPSVRRTKKEGQRDMASAVGGGRQSELAFERRPLFTALPTFPVRGQRVEEETSASALRSWRCTATKNESACGVFPGPTKRDSSSNVPSLAERMAMLCCTSAT